MKNGLYMSSEKNRRLSQNEKPVPALKPGLYLLKSFQCIWRDIKGVAYYEQLIHKRTLSTDAYCQQIDRVRKLCSPALINRDGIII